MIYQLTDTVIYSYLPAVRREDRDGRVVRVNNSQLRDSHLDLPPEKVTPWYRALRLYNETMERLSIRLKLNDGRSEMESCS